MVRILDLIRQRWRGRSEESDRALIADERARIPFALIGVLLLVTSAAYAVGVTDQGLVGEDRSVERAVERVDADTTTALRIAARETAHDAATNPVTKPPNQQGEVAAAVREESAFEDAFRVQLAIAGSEALSAVDTEVGGVTATASLPTVDDPSELENARDRVHVDPVANGTATRVTFEAVETTATRDGRVVAERTENRTVVVAVPTLAAHQRTEQFEERLNRGAVEGPGLGRQITASLYPMTWARGYAQYAGAPVENVLANRHVELSTNAGIVRTQRDVFGTSDPDARGGVARATARTGLTDLLEPTGVDEGSWTDVVLDTPTPTSDEPSEDTAFDPGSSESQSIDEQATVTAGHAADVGMTEVYDDFDEIIRGVYRVEASVETSTSQSVDGGSLTPPVPEDGPSWEWERTGVSHSEQISTVSGSDVPRGTPAGVADPGDDVSFGAATREVAVERAATAEWEREVVKRAPNGSVIDTTIYRATTHDETKDRYRVRVSASGRHAPSDRAPDRPAATFGAGSITGGPDLRGTPAAARAELAIDTRSEIDQIARQAVRDGDITRSTTVYGSRASEDHDRIASDVSTLASTIREIETEPSMEDAAVGESDPYGDLVKKLRDRRAALVDAPTTYNGATDRARIAAREAYLDAVIEELEAASSDHEDATDGFLERVNGAFDGPSVGEVIASREAARNPGTQTVGDHGPGGAVTFTPDGSPGYLPRTTVDGAAVEGVNGTTTRPLATRNLNYVTVPYGEVSTGITDRILGTEDTVRLGTAGRALLLADEALDTKDDPDLRADRNTLHRQVDRSLDAVDRELQLTLRERTSLSRAERSDVIDSAAASYDSTGERAAAVGDGSYPERVAVEAAASESMSTASQKALAARLRVTTRNAAERDAVRVPTRFVDEPTSGARMLLRDRMEDAIEDGATEVGERAAERWAPNPVRSVGAGLPIAPVPGYWVTTVNAWRVQVRGEYPQFALRADVGTPDRPFEYVRSEGEVAIDIDGDSVQLGETEPVQFDTGTVVVVAVPAGPPGVGDVDGTRDETSTGWPCPGSIDESTDECASA